MKNQILILVEGNVKLSLQFNNGLTIIIKCFKKVITNIDIKYLIITTKNSKYRKILYYIY